MFADRKSFSFLIESSPTRLTRASTCIYYETLNSLRVISFKDEQNGKFAGLYFLGIGLGR